MQKQVSQKGSLPVTKTESIKGTFYRMIRRSNGWQIEVLKDGRVTLLGDWDLRHIIESKLLGAIMRTSEE